MTAQKKLIKTVTMLYALFILILPAAQADVENVDEPNGPKVTKIKVNGRFADAMLNAGDTNGFLTASKDQITDTSALDFAYAFPDPTNPNIVFLIQGAGEIPNNAFTITATSANLSVTTPFPVIRCEVDINDGSFFCDETTPSTFDLTWAVNGFETVTEKTKRTETLGPFSARSHGEFTQHGAAVIQSWDGYFNPEGYGYLSDTRGVTFFREVSLQPNQKGRRVSVYHKMCDRWAEWNEVTPNNLLQQTAYPLPPNFSLIIHN